MFSCFPKDRKNLVSQDFLLSAPSQAIIFIKKMIFWKI